VKAYRVSNVERFRQWEQDEEAEVADLVADILGMSEPSPLMLAGTAFHKALEVADTGDGIPALHADGYEFLFEGDGFEVALAPVRELRASKVYTVDGEPFRITGQVDALCGLRIEDHKTTGRFDPERYIGGCQWKLYLDIFGADHFRWNVFEIREGDHERQFRVMDQHRLEQFRYPTLGADCQALVERFARFVRSQIECTAAA
jgi:hypothetical protein